MSEHGPQLFDQSQLPPPGPPVGNATGRPTDPLGVITFVLGLLGFLVITVPVALILGVAALARIRRTGHRGRGLAVAGLTIAVLWAAGIAAVAVAAIDAGPKRPPGPIEGPVTLPPKDVKLGDCVADVPTGEVDGVRVVPCGGPGASKVFAVFELTGKSWPGEKGINDLASKGCADRYKAPSGKPGKEPEVFFIRPTENFWKIGDRTVLCVATPAD
jgi:hypothetical protein